MDKFDYGESNIVKKAFRSLRWQVAKAWLKLHPHVDVIGITGSVGKTSGKEMIKAVLSEVFKIEATRENLDPIFNIPLTVLRLQDNEKMICEMGVDDFGQMSAYLELVQPRIGVVTELSLAHADESHFGSLDGLIEEKSKLIKGLSEHSWAVLNGDSNKVRSLAKKTKAWVLTYGFGKDNDIVVSSFTHFDRGKKVGSKFKINYGLGEEEVEIKLMGRHNAKLAAMTVAVGMIEGMKIEEIKRGLKKIKPVEQRLEPKWAGERLIIDDTYNASPQACKAAIEVLADLDKKGVFVMGDMLELGKHSKRAHKHVGEYAAKKGVSKLAVLGEESKSTADGIIKAGGDRQRVLRAESPEEIVEWLKEGQETVLVKGSRGMRMERVVEGLME